MIYVLSVAGAAYLTRLLFEAIDRIEGHVLPVRRRQHRAAVGHGYRCGRDALDIYTPDYDYAIQYGRQSLTVWWVAPYETEMK